MRIHLCVLAVCATLPLFGSLSGCKSSSSGEPDSSQNGDEAGDDGTNGGTQIRLPIEVLGSGSPDEPAIAGTRLGLESSDVGSAERLVVLFTWPSVFYLAPHMLYAPEQTSPGKREFYS